MKQNMKLLVMGIALYAGTTVAMQQNKEAESRKELYARAVGYKLLANCTKFLVVGECAHYGFEIGNHFAAPAYAPRHQQLRENYPWIFSAYIFVGLTQWTLVGGIVGWRSIKHFVKKFNDKAEQCMQLAGAQFKK